MLFTISSTAAVGSYSECTCGHHTYGIWHYQEFVNYCPLCGSYGSLGVYYLSDGDTEIHCYNCGADYCAYDGWEKSGSYMARLTVYTPPKQKQEDKPKTVKKPKSRLTIAKEIYSAHQTIF